jgi:hypothetical protein
MRRILILLLCLGAYTVRAQEVKEGGIVMLAEVIDGDTIPVKYLNTVMIVGERRHLSRREKAKWTRLQYNVKKVYPYAKLAGQLLEKYSVPLDTITNERERKKYFKLIEDELKAEFEDDLRSMTTTQGMILIKLVDRETQHSSYEIVQEFRGNFSAFFWQGLSKLFGQDLKSRYDPNGDDKEIESIIVLIEAGLI